MTRLDLASAQDWPSSYGPSELCADCCVVPRTCSVGAVSKLNSSRKWTPTARWRSAISRLMVSTQRPRSSHHGGRSGARSSRRTGHATSGFGTHCRVSDRTSASRYACCGNTARLDRRPVLARPGHRRKHGEFIGYAVWEQIRTRTDLFEPAAVWSPITTNIATGEQTELVETVIASGSFFDVLGVPEIAGRAFSAPSHAWTPVRAG